MHQTIKALWHGNIEPMESVGTQPAYREKARAWLDAEREFCALLNEKEKTLFEALCMINTEMDSIAQEYSFAQGFCLGVRLVTEAFGDT